jgi:Domain of unknown function (DUF4397)
MRSFYFIIIIPVLLLSCKKESDSFAGKSNITIVNMAPGVANLDVFVDGSRANALPLSYLGSLVSAGKNYLEVDAGVRELRVSSGSTSFFASNISLEKDRNYTMVFYDTLTANKLNYVLLTDDLSVTDTAFAKVRFIYTIPDAQESKFYLYNTLTGANDSITRLTYITKNPPGSLFSTFFPIKNGYRDIALTQVTPFSILYSRLNFYFEPGKSYTFFASGFFTVPAYPGRVTFIKHN